MAQSKGVWAVEVVVSKEMLGVTGGSSGGRVGGC